MYLQKKRVAGRAPFGSVQDPPGSIRCSRGVRAKESVLSGRRWRCRPRVLKLKENSTCSHRLILDSFYSYVVHHLHTSTQRIPAHPSTSSSVAHLVAVWMACSAALGGSSCCCWGMFREGVDILTHQHDHGSEPRWLSASSTVFQGPSKIACGTNSGTAVTCGKNSWRTRSRERRIRKLFSLKVKLQCQAVCIEENG